MQGFTSNPSFSGSQGGQFIVSDQARTVPLGTRDIPSDCDSEGNDPPSEGFTFTDPNAVEEVLLPPPRTNAEIKLPYYMPKPRSRIRDQYEPKVTYEEWIDGEVAAKSRQGATTQARREVKKLEEDSDLPVGKSYFWHAYCTTCGVSYHPHVPGMWTCPGCRERVWQQPNDPDSKKCAHCARAVSKIRELGAHKVRNPMARNSHMCKRCGRIVCDQCYIPKAVKLEQWGYQEPQRVCIRCEKDMDVKPPEEEDYGTLHEEFVGDTEDAAMCQPYWVPKCMRCNITFGQPPPRWQCPSCGQAVWQSSDSVEATTCWMCPAKFPKVRCHRCGQLACHACAAYAQPLPSMGFKDGAAVTVCKGCYEGISLRPAEMDPTLVEEFKPKPVTPICPVCKVPPRGGKIPKEWLSECHRRKCWMLPDNPSAKKCAVCATVIAEGTRENCNMCGRLVCIPCAQYKQPVPELFAKGLSMTVCRSCFHPKMGLLPDHTDSPFWPPKCPKCEKSWAQPPDRWRCTNQCGLVWQPADLIVSKACYTCGAKVSSPVNCRMCGRIVCATCGEHRAEVTERGFTKGVTYPVCVTCKPKKDSAQGQGAPGSPGGRPPTGR